MSRTGDRPSSLRHGHLQRKVNMPSGMSILCVSLCMTLPSTFAVEGYTMIPR